MIVLFFKVPEKYSFAVLKNLYNEKQKRIIEIINRFPKLLKHIKEMLCEENVDYIPDASEYPQPASLLSHVSPDMLLLNLRLNYNTAIDLMGLNMQDFPDLKMVMITCNRRAFYMSLCSTLGAAYFIDTTSSLKHIPEIVSKQQLN
jgi:DNA-binding NarL/FixJ family response regulator